MKTLSGLLSISLLLAAGSACSASLDAGPPDAAIGGTADALDAAGNDDTDARSTTQTPDAAPVETPVPIFIAARNYQENRDALRTLGPFIIYAWATDPALSNPAQYDAELSVLAAIDDPGVEEIVMFSSHRTVAAKLAQPGHLAYLSSIGVTGLGYNSEGFMTPSDEMDSLNSASQAVNAVARFAAIAEASGMSVLWGPIRFTADAVSDPAVSAMFGAGLDGVGLQEQQFIEASCVDARASAVQTTATRYRSLASGMGAAAPHVNVQIMPSRCLNGDQHAASSCGDASTTRFHHCARFADAIAGDVDSIGIWASSPQDRADLVPLIRALRAQ